MPAHTDARWWTEYALQSDEIRFIAGRLRFDDGTEPAPFPSAIVIFRPPTRWAGPGDTTYTLRRLNRSAISYIERIPAP